MSKIKETGCEKSSPLLWLQVVEQLCLKLLQEQLQFNLFHAKDQKKQRNKIFYVLKTILIP